MESSNDLLSIPTWDDCSQDRWYQYDDDEWRSSGYDIYKYRRRIHQKYMEKYHYDNISRLGVLISEVDRLILLRSKGAAAAIRTVPLNAEKARLVQRRQELELKWKSIANRMTRDSQKLFILPKEIREKIFGYLYTRSSALEINLPDFDVRYSMLPRDPYLYLNANVVDPVIAAEAAQVLYDTNRFNVVAWSTDSVANFLRTDHFNSGIAPKDVIRIFRMAMYGHTEFKSEAHIEFECRCRDSYEHHLFGRDRAKLAVLLEMRQLQRLDLTLDLRGSEGAFEFRGVSPVIRMLHEQGVTVNVQAGFYTLLDDAARKFDLPAIFIAPTQREREVARQDDGDGTIETHIESLRRRVYDLQCLTPGTLAQWRVYLDKHYEAFQAIESEEKGHMLMRAKTRLDAIATELAYRQEKLAGE